MKKTMIFMLLCAAMATAFTACDSLIPNDPPAEEENTQGGNDNTGGTDGTEDEGGSGNNEEEDPSPEVSGKLVKEINWVDDEKQVYEYDENGRITKISVISAYSPEYDYFYELRYIGDNTIQFLYNGDDPTPLNFIFDEEGYLIRTEIDENYYTEYKYSDGVMASSYTYVCRADGIFSANATAEYENGNCTLFSREDKYVDTDGDSDDTSYEDSYGYIWTYTDIENKMNVDIFSTIRDPEEMGLYFKGISSRNLPDRFSLYTYDYELDAEGYVTKVIMSNESEGSVETCLVEYIDYPL